jgi:catechol 2,3-dioxygenase-like lactoylglutathione lyase family enzyme
MIDHIDHIVLTTGNETACVDFYVNLLGMKLEIFGDNLHVKGSEFEPKAHLPVPGSLDLCFIASIPLTEVIRQLRGKSAEIIEGPVRRTGAKGVIESVYLRDPDLNLVEISEYVPDA